MVGRLIPRKNIDLLFEALPKVEAKYPFMVRVIGDGPERTALEQMVGEWKLTSLVDFVGSVPYNKLIEYYSEADVLVHCSQAEGMPLVVLEAMACGLSIVATRVQGIEDLVESGENGYLFEPGDVDTLAQYLTLIINLKHQRLSMGQRSLQKVRLYDWSTIAQRYLDLYKKIIRA
jgi:glycosyltransferase involved in cell wall biosynthesis